MKELRVDSGAPGEINLTATWRKESTYVVAPTGDQRGFVIRLDRRAGEGSRLHSGKPGSQRHFRRQFGVAADSIRGSGNHGGEPQIQDDRLRVEHRIGRHQMVPAARRANVFAQRRRTTARAFPGFIPARLAGHRRRRSGGARRGQRDAPAGRSAIPDPPLPAEERAQILAAAKSAMAARDYKSAVESLTIFVRQPEYAERAEAQELLGLSRERFGQLAHAKAEYEEYLRRYPNGPAVDRIRARLKALALAGRKPRNVVVIRQPRCPWAGAYSGGLAQLYRRDQNNISSTGVSFNQTSQNAIINNADFVARRRGEKSTSWAVSMRAIPRTC